MTRKTAPMICPVCGSHNDDQASFCSQCGAPLRSPLGNGRPYASGTAAGSAGSGGANGSGGSSGDSGGGGRRRGRRGRNGRGRWHLVLIVVLAIVAVLAVTDVVGSIWYSSGTNAVKYSEDAVLYDPQTSGFTITSLDNDAWTVTVSDIGDLREGSVLAAGITDETPYGLLRRVTAIAPVDGGYLLSTEPAALTDLIDYCDVSSSITLLPDGTYRVDEEQTGSGPFSWVRRAIADDSDPIEQFAWKYEEDGDAGLDLEFTAGINFEPSLKIDHGDVDAKFYFRVYARAEVGLKGVTETDFDPVSLYQAVVPLPDLPVVGVLNIDLEPELSATIREAAISNEVELNHSFGVQYKNGVLSPYSEDHSTIGGSGLSPDDAETLFGVTGEAEAMLSVSYYLYDIWGPKISVGPHVEATVALEAVDADAQEAAQTDAQTSGGGGALEDVVQYGEPIRLPGLDVDLRGRLNVKVTVPISGVFEFNTDGIFDSVPSKISPLFIFGKTENGEYNTEIKLFDTDDAITLYDSGDITFGPTINDADALEAASDAAATSTSDADQEAWPVGTWVGTTSSGGHELFEFAADGTFDEWTDGQYKTEAQSDGWKPSWYEEESSREIVYSYLPPERMTTGTTYRGIRTDDDQIAVYCEAAPDSLVMTLTRASTNRSSADGSGDSVDFDTPYFSVEFPDEWGSWQETIDAANYTMAGGATVEHYYFLRSEDLGEWVCFVVYDPNSGQGYGQDDTVWVLDEPTSSGLRVAVGFNFEFFEDAFQQNYSSINYAIGDGTTVK
jgi:hypothetical protein